MNGRRQNSSISENLRHAQARLTWLREQRGTAVNPAPSPPAPPPTLDTPTTIAQLPSHLGWGSEPLTAVIRRANVNSPTSIANQPEANQLDSNQVDWPSLPANEQPEPAVPLTSPQTETITLYPDIGLAMLREEQTAAGRVWLLLRHLDRDGRGWLTLTQARERLTSAESAYRICGERQLRNLLAHGDDLFWTRQNGRLWLRSINKVALRLNVARLSGRPVKLPIKALLSGIGRVRAHLYAAFHSSRNGETVKPIARATLQKLSRVSRRSQRNYEQRTNIRCQRNLAVGELDTERNRERRGQRHGQALFTFTDNKGNHGSPGTQYLAWQLPNSYIGPHKPAPQGRQKRINRELADLFMQGMTGNGEEMIDRAAQPKRRFQVNGAQAAKKFSRDREHDLYWPKPDWPNQAKGNARAQLWHLLPGQTETNEG